MVDGAALVHFLSPKDITSFRDYFHLQVLPHLRYQAEYFGTPRLDLVWDLYFADSTKAATRASRGAGVRRKDLSTKGKKIINIR